MHAPAQFQADVALEGHGVGADLHLLVGGDARIGPAQVRRADAAAGQQCLTGQPLVLEGAQHQGDGVEGGEVGMKHVRFQPGEGWKRSKLYAG
ncbi:hypothetical protein D3C84_703140 [compost metagenome]